MSNPILFYEGPLPDHFTVTPEFSTIKNQVFILDWAKPECKKWQHYYNDSELNTLSRILKFGLRFFANDETAINETSGFILDFQPFWRDGFEYSICFSYKEFAPNYGRCFLNAILVRELSKKDFNKRVTEIKKYWM